MGQTLPFSSTDLWLSLFSAEVKVYFLPLLLKRTMTKMPPDRWGSSLYAVIFVKMQLSIAFPTVRNSFKQKMAANSILSMRSTQPQKKQLWMKNGRVIWFESVLWIANNAFPWSRVPWPMAKCTCLWSRRTAERKCKSVLGLFSCQSKCSQLGFKKKK